MSRHSSATPLVVAISGISGSGKTTLTRLLAYRLNGTSIFWDDFDEISHAPADYVAWYESGSPGGATAWDYPLLADTLRTLKAGKPLRSPANGENLGPRAWIFFDAPWGRDHQQTAPCIDFLVHLATPLDIALARRILRDYNAETLTKDLLEDIRFYIERSRPLFAEQPKEKIDLVVDAAKPLGVVAREITEYLQAKFPQRFIVEKPSVSPATALLELSKITFAHPKNSHFALVLNWFYEPHVREYFDDPLTGNSIPGLRNYLDGKEYFFTPWMAFYEDRPFAFLMTAEVKAEGSDPIWRQWRESTGKTYSLDLFIGEEKFMGRGFGHLLIKKFIGDYFQHAHAFLIDPEARNTRAIHVYEKAGFTKVAEFVPKSGQHAGLKHILLKLSLK